MTSSGIEPATFRNKSNIQSKTALIATQTRDSIDDNDDDNYNNNTTYGDRGGENAADWRRTWCKAANLTIEHRGHNDKVARNKQAFMPICHSRVMQLSM
jgi:hypothetical protein